MSKCHRCGKEWTPERAPGTHDKPISGFYFRFISKGAKMQAWDATGAPIHPFIRDDVEIVACPTCMSVSGRTSGEIAMTVAQENLGAKTFFGTDGSVTMIAETEFKADKPFPYSMNDLN